MVYLAEKGIELETVLVDLRRGEQRSPEHLARNPLGSVPVLELDDGSYLTESIVIMEYLEECFPEPSMIGETAVERARTRRLERIADFSVLVPLARVLHATNSPLGLPPLPEMAERARRGLPEAVDVLDRILRESKFLGGERPSIADCTLYGALAFARLFDVPLQCDAPSVESWFDDFDQRSSAARTRI